MNKTVAIFILIAVSSKISAQTESLKLPLPDTSKFLFDIKSTFPINTNFNSLNNAYPSKLAIEYGDFYVTANESVRQDSLNIPEEQKINVNLLFVRSAYFTGKSPLFVEQKKRSFDYLSDSEYGRILSVQILKAYNAKYGNSKKSLNTGISIRLGLLDPKKEKLRKAAEKRKRAYVY
ncbi:MAG: hypothetical protein LBK94_09935 [Prevotellaceae bacterium]|jgi:hypothetical protein|nr:hypothetical protein [Prevotellaceae bacterium]